MVVYLNEEELKREKSMYAPHEVCYAELEGEVLDISAYKETAAEGEDLTQSPTSC